MVEEELCVKGTSQPRGNDWNLLSTRRNPLTASNVDRCLAICGS